MAGSVTITYSSPSKIVKWVKWAWVSDGSGDVSGTDTVELDGVAVAFVTNPSSTAPTDNYDITILDTDSADIAAGGLANRDTSNSERVVPDPPAAFSSKLSLVVASAGDSKEGTLTMFYQGV